MLTIISVLYVSFFKGDKQLSSWKRWTYLEKKYRKYLMPLVYFNKKVLIRFWSVYFVLVLFFSPASLSHSFYCVFLVQAFLKFNVSLLCVAFMVYHQRGWCETMLLPLKQLSASFHLWGCNHAIWAQCWGHWVFFPRKQNCWVMLIMSTYPVVCLCMGG